MTDKKISDLISASSLASTDFLEIDTGSASKRITGAQIGDYVESRSSLTELIRDTIGTAIAAGSHTNVTIAVNDGGDSFSFSASGGGGAASKRHPGYAPGHWYRPMPVTGASATLTANYIVTIPFSVTEDIVLTDLGIRLNTGVASTHCVLGIYANDNTTHRPSTLLGSTSSMSSASSGVNLTETLSSPITLSAGIYWIASTTDGAIVSLCMGTAEGQLGWSVGSSTGNVSTPPLCFSVARAFDGSLPSIFTSGGTANTSQNCPLIMFKVA